MKSPIGKSDLLNRLLSFDFNGDWRTLGEGVSVKRIKPHILQLTFPETGRTFELVVRIPRGEGKSRSSAKPGIAVGRAPPAPTHDGDGKPARGKGPRKRQAVKHH